MKTPLLNIADRPPTTATQDDTVKQAVQTMVEHRVGAVAVLDGTSLAGVFTERDLMTKVIHRGLDPATTPLRDVMVRDLVVVKADRPREEALQLMLGEHFRHLPVVGDDGALVGMVSIRNLLNNQYQRLKDDVESLEQFIAADGIGG